MTMRYGSIGTVSHGTLRPEDLITTFAAELQQLVQDNTDAWCSDEGRAKRDGYLDLVGRAQDLENCRSEAADFVLDDLNDALGEFAPPNCYFGVHVGDASDFGFWPNEEDCGCGHSWEQHKRTPNGAWACTHHGCGCLGVVMP